MENGKTKKIQRVGEGNLIVADVTAFLVNLTWQPGGTLGGKTIGSKQKTKKPVLYETNLKINVVK